MEDAGELYQFSSVYRHLVLNKYAVVRVTFVTRSAKPYYLCAVVLFDISKDSDIVDSYELLLGDVVDQYLRYKCGEDTETVGEGGDEGKWGCSTETELLTQKGAITHVDGDTLPSKST